MIKPAIITEKTLDTADNSPYNQKLPSLNIRNNIEEIIFSIEEGKADIYLRKMLKILNALLSWNTSDNWPKQVALNFANCHLIDDHVNLLLELVNKIRQEAKITCLNIEGNAFSDDFITKLIQPLSKVTKLPDLNLKETQITVQGIEALANIEDSNNQRITLDVNHNLKEHVIFNNVPV